MNGEPRDSAICLACGAALWLIIGPMLARALGWL